MKLSNRKKIILAVVAAAVVVVWLAGVLLEYGAVSASALAEYQSYLEQQTNTDETGWTQITPAEGGTVVLENARFTLTLETDTTRFVVVDRLSGAEYTSYSQVSTGLMLEEDIAHAHSNIGITYYDADSKPHYLGSGIDSVDKGQYEIYRKDNALRILYTIGSAANDTLAPSFISETTMETSVFSQLKVSEKMRLKLYYKLYSPESMPDDYQEVIAAYPALEGKSVYILTSDVTEQILSEISDLMKKSGFTQEAADADMQQLGVDAVETALPAGFFIPLELVLNDNGFVARVLSDRITENNDTDRLTDLYILEQFGAQGKDAEGYLLVPDGSGAQIAMNQPSPASYSQPLYNEDLLLNIDTEHQLSRNVPLPYFGMACPDGSFLAYIDSGSAVGTIFGRTIGKANPLNMVGARFQMRTFDQTDIGQDRNIPTLNIYNGHILKESPTVCYSLLPYNEEVLSDMTLVLRQYLKAVGVEDTVAIRTNGVPLYLDFLCLSTKDVDVIGITVKRDVVLSTITDIQTVVDQLHNAGIHNLQIRLKNWTEDGMLHGAFDTCALSSKVGTLEQLQKLRSSIEEKGGRLYLDTDFSFAQVNETFDSLRTARDISRNLERAAVSLKTYDPVTLKQQKTFRQGYVITPFSYVSFAESFLDEFKDGYNGIGLSWSNGGMYLLADYDKDNDLDRAYAAHVTSSVFDRLQQASGAGVMTDYGYAYTLPFVSDIVNAPLTCSYFTSETASLPIMQMALSGTKNYTGAALNFTGTRSQLTEMAATAAAPYYLLMTADDSVLRDLDMQMSYYSLDYRKHIEDMINAYTTYIEQTNSVYGEQITSFEWLTNTVSCTTFANGKRMLVNRGNVACTVAEITLQAYEYVLVG